MKLAEGRKKTRINSVNGRRLYLYPNVVKRHLATTMQRNNNDNVLIFFSLCFHLDFTHYLFSNHKFQSINGQVSYSAGVVTPIDHVYRPAWSRRGPIQYERLTSFLTLLITISNRLTDYVSSCRAASTFLPVPSRFYWRQ